MNGRHVFSEGVRKMGQVLQEFCRSAHISLRDLDLIIPHQANQRIIEALTHRLHLDAGKVFSNIGDRGNSSSNTIPLALADLQAAGLSPDSIGLTAFGGGFTYAATVLHRAAAGRDTGRTEARGDSPSGR